MKDSGRWVATGAIAMLLSGCATTSVLIPEGYGGPIATIKDNAVSETKNRGQFFYVAEIDGKRVDNALQTTRVANSGAGFALSPVPFAREVPVRPMTLKLQARVAYGAPLQAMANATTLYAAESVLTFTPEPNKNYLVTGALNESQQLVWLQDEQGNKLAADAPASK